MAATDETAGVSKSTVGYALPLVVAVTGHRELVADEVPQIRARVKSLFEELCEKYPYSSLTILSPLAEGADMLVAEVALELDLDLVVPLPKSKQDYLDDFKSKQGREHFEQVLSKATDVFELSENFPAKPDDIHQDEWEAAFPYTRLGAFLCSHCHILLAIWDGYKSDKMGGAAQVVKFHHDDVMRGLTPKTGVSQQMLVDDESDLVFHIPCSRNKVGYEPHPEIDPLDWCWYTKDEKTPRSKTLPAQHELIFQRSSEFSADAIKFADSIETEKLSLLTDEEPAELAVGAARINHLYCIADWLAIYYQKKTLRTLLITHWVAFLMGLMFILYSDIESVQLLLFAFLGFFAFAVAAQYVANKGAWQRKYLDCRTLAEGLRVQFYWAAVGVTAENKWKFAHDSFLQTQNPEFGWIRNVMRVAGIRCDAAPYLDPAGVEYTLREWIGGPDQGQLGYFRVKAHERIRHHANTEKLGWLSLLTSVSTVFIFLLFGSMLTDLWESVLIFVMGSTLLVYAVREGYSYATATKELIKQYEFMLRIFDNAHRRLSAVTSSDEKRQILSALGQSALDEHSDWILMHRERSLDESEIWRMGA